VISESGVREISERFVKMRGQLGKINMNRTSFTSNISRAFLLSLAIAGAPVMAQTETVEPAPTAVIAASNAPTRTIDAAQTTVLNDAIKRKQWDAAKTAVLAGADVNAVDKKGVTVLMRACEARQTELVEALLQNGAKTEAADGIGRTALHYAIPEGNQPKKKKFGFGSVMSAMGGLGSVLGGVGMLGGLGGFGSLLGGGGVESLLGGNLASLLGGGGFNLTGKSGWSAIAGAALQGDTGGKFGIAQMLSGQGAGNLDAGGWTNMMSSVKGSNPQILSAMSKLGTGADAQNNPMWDQFLNAASSGDQASVAEMMQKPEMQVLLAQAQTGLSGAASELPGNASRTIIESLIKNGAKTTAATRDGDTPAKIAQERGLPEIAALLGAQ
jgi:hypothetical protein